MARITKQLSFLKDPRKNTKLWWIAKQSTYGGSLNYRKVCRPFDSKKLTHAVFKSNLGREMRFTKFETTVRGIIERSARKYGIKLNDLAIHHNHIHVLIFTKSREAQRCFLRLVSAHLGRRYAALRRRLGFRKQALWVGRPFTRLVSWGKKSLSTVRRYLNRNRGEAMGFLPYKPRNHRLSAFLELWAQKVQSTA